MATRAQRPIFWQSHINGWRASGLSQTHYCAKHDLSKTSFAKWRKRLGADGLAGPPAPPKFVPVRVTDKPDSTASEHRRRSAGPPASIFPAPPRELPCPMNVEIRLRGGRAIMVGSHFDEAVLTHLIKLLERLPC